MRANQFPSHSNVINIEKNHERIKHFYPTMPLLLEKKLPEIIFVTSFPPRECGIATYTQDLIHVLQNQFEQSFKCTICALESTIELPLYMQQPAYQLNTDVKKSFIDTANDINKNNEAKLIVIQHEFGFFALNEAAFKDFYHQINKPIVFVFHTVLPYPSAQMLVSVKDIAQIANSIIVMTKDAAKILIEVYQVALSKIHIIPHGTHLVSPVNKNNMKEKNQIQHRKVLATFGLLGSSKSIETTLTALPAIIKKHPEVLFLILGKTHPSVVKNENEKYRDMLEAKVIELGIEYNVLFVNEYLSLPKLLEYLQLTDIYLFTSKDPHQAVSGTFSYAMSSGCPVISTPIPQAKELFNDNQNIIIDFKHSEQLAIAVNSLLDNENLRAEISMNNFQKMASTAWQNSAISHAQLFKAITKNEIELHYCLPEINLNHIKNLTTTFGMIQFSKIAFPDITSGYTLDDNARALISICMHYEISHDAEELKLIETYLQFIQYCLQPNGDMLNYVNEFGAFTNQNEIENLEDSTGRTVWALGYMLHTKKNLPSHLIQKAEAILTAIIPSLDKIHSTRAMAFIIKGLYYQNNANHNELLQLFANRMVQMYKHEKAEQWFWFENYFTYGNSLLSEAMLLAYLRTHDGIYKNIAKESFDFLLSKIFANGRIKVVSNKGWHTKNEVIEIQVGGEQPIDVAYTILALEKFYSVFKLSDYKYKAITAFNWFLGANHLNQIVYNPCTGGCYDGVEEYNVNLNQGAESALSYLMARLSIERTKTFQKQLNIKRTYVMNYKRSIKNTGKTLQNNSNKIANFDSVLCNEPEHSIYNVFKEFYG